MGISGGRDRRDAGDGRAGPALPFRRVAVSRGAAARADMEAMLVAVLDMMLDRMAQADDGYDYVNTKLSTITGEDFSDGDDGLRGPSTIYSWIQGRGLEALAVHRSWLLDPRAAPAGLPAAERRRRADAAAAAARRATAAVQRARAAHPDGLPFRFDAASLRRVDCDAAQPHEAGWASASDFFCAKGLCCAAAAGGDAALAAGAAAWFRDVCDGVAAGRFYNDQPQGLARVDAGGGFAPQGWHMLVVGGCGTMYEATGDVSWLERACVSVRHVLSRHVARAGGPGVAAGLREHDFYEYADASGTPLVADGVVACNVGHCAEFVGFAAKACLLCQRHARNGAVPPLSAEAAAAVADCKEDLPALLLRGMELGFRELRRPDGTATGGVQLGVDLVARAATHPMMPWWTTTEAIRAAALVLDLAPGSPHRPAVERLCADLCNAFTQGSVNERAHLLAFQTRDADGAPLAYVPATPDADPGYHTGLAIIDFLASRAGGGDGW